MKPPARLVSWLTPEELSVWVRESPTKEAYQKRLAIWLTHLHHSASEIADLLQVSKQAVWLWVGQYNRQGPHGLLRQGRGGRRWSYLSQEAEASLLRSVEQAALAGQILTAPRLLPEVERAVGKPVSLDYVYKLLHRQGWRKLGPRPQHVKADQEAQEAFKKNSPNSCDRRPPSRRQA